MEDQPNADSEAAPNANISRRALLRGGFAGAALLLGGLASPLSRAAETGAVSAPLRILFVLYPKFTLLDFAGANEVFARLPNMRVQIASPEGGTVVSDTHVPIQSSAKLADAESCDLICVPGGTDRSNMLTPDIQQHLRRLSDSAKYVTSICNGSLILGAAGLLNGHRSACHWAQRNLLPQFGAIPDAARVVMDGHYMSGGGVTAGIDFALTFAAKLRGPVQAQVVQLLM